MECWEISGADKATYVQPSETGRLILNKAIKLPYGQEGKSQKSSGKQNLEPYPKGSLTYM